MHCIQYFLCCICSISSVEQKVVLSISRFFLLQSYKTEPAVFIVEITTRSERKHEHSSEKRRRGGEKEILFLGRSFLLISHTSIFFWETYQTFFGTRSNLDFVQDKNKRENRHILRAGRLYIWETSFNFISCFLLRKIS